eukprot:8849102-Alexandrium_andersonii.AAC.1
MDKRRGRRLICRAMSCQSHERRCGLSKGQPQGPLPHTMSPKGPNKRNAFCSSALAASAAVPAAWLEGAAVPGVCVSGAAVAAAG